MDTITTSVKLELNCHSSFIIIYQNGYQPDLYYSIPVSWNYSNTQEMQYYGSAVIPQLGFAYLFYKAASVLAALQETTEVKLYLGVSPCRLGGLLVLTALLS